MDPLKSMAAMFPHLYGGIPSSASLQSTAAAAAAAISAQKFPMIYSPSSVINPLLSGLGATDSRFASGQVYGGTTEQTPDGALISSSRSSPTNSVTGSQIKVTLDDKELWRRFHQFGTEMIVTRSGRRMFPILKVKVEGLDRNKKYYIFLDILPMDDARYKFCNGQWAVSGRAEPYFPSRMFVHPDSPAYGKHWMEEGLISFHRVKLTNNNKDQTSGNMLLNSMHRYQPRIHVAEMEDAISANWANFHTFTFPTTSFFAVTAYQNENITQLKIDNNPFAKGFRDREKVFPQKRSAPFIEQLKEAASTEIKQRRTRQDESKDNADGSPTKSELVNSSVRNRIGSSPSPAESFTLYHNTKLELLRQQLLRQHDTLQAANPFFPLGMNKLPMVNLPFSLFPNSPCS